MRNVSHCWVAEDSTGISAQKIPASKRWRIPASKRWSSSHWCSRWRCSFDLLVCKEAFFGWSSAEPTLISSRFSLQASGRGNVALSHRRGTSTRGFESSHCGQLRPAGSCLGILWWEQWPVLMFLKFDPKIEWLLILNQIQQKSDLFLFIFSSLAWYIWSAWTHFSLSG